jgi:hypothetical protein
MQYFEYSTIPSKDDEVPTKRAEIYSFCSQRPLARNMYIGGIMFIVMIAFTRYAQIWPANFVKSPKVSVEVYFEALCPFCQKFVTGPLSNIMEVRVSKCFYDIDSQFL